jgi:hypothetical protein
VPFQQGRNSTLKKSSLRNFLDVYFRRYHAACREGFEMAKKLCVLPAILMLWVPAWAAQKQAGKETINCRAMEVFQSKQLGTTAVIFHQRDKADGPRLGALLLAHSGEDVEFETSDGRRHSATVGRVKSCFGRGLLLFRSKEAKLAAKDDFVLQFAAKK